jgi:hypothetical protein
MFRELDGRTFHRFDDLVDEVLTRMNLSLGDFPVGYGYRDAIGMARRRGWLMTTNGGRTVTVHCGASAGADAARLAA